MSSKYIKNKIYYCQLCHKHMSYLIKKRHLLTENHIMNKVFERDRIACNQAILEHDKLLCKNKYCKQDIIDYYSKLSLQ